MDSTPIPPPIPVSISGQGGVEYPPKHQFMTAAGWDPKVRQLLVNKVGASKIGSERVLANLRRNYPNDIIILILWKLIR
jgi:hypothetical protein